MSKEKIPVNIAPALRDYIVEETKSSSDIGLYIVLTLFLLFSLYIIAFVVIAFNSITVIILGSLPFILLIIISLTMLVYSERKKKKIISGDDFETN